MVYDGICQQYIAYEINNTLLWYFMTFHDVWIIDNYFIFFHAMPSSQLLQLTNSRAHLNNSALGGAVPLE